MINKIKFDKFDTSGISIVIPKTKNDIIDIALGGNNKRFEVKYDVKGKNEVTEAVVVRCKNGLSINYTETYMRRRDPDCLFIGDKEDTDKVRFSDEYGYDFDSLRSESFEWLKSQKELLFMPFYSGGIELRAPSLLIAPVNAGFFAGGLADLQEFIPYSELPDNFKPEIVIYLAPTFRHTHFKGKQVVVHNRLNDMYEMFAYNLYPGPSAKKGVYGALLHLGEKEGWTTLHASTVKIKNNFNNKELVMMHEGASGGGKSEMIQAPHYDSHNKLVVGVNTITGEKFTLDYADSMTLYPVTDDMALAHLAIQKGKKKLILSDAESGWFIRVDHIKEYGTEPSLEKITVHPKSPLVFLNLDGKEDATCLIWEHTMDAPGKRCPNPRVVVPRSSVANIINTPVEVDVRSFGFRAPPCTRENPTYGIIGLFHILPPALGWLWRLVSPRGHANPSIADSEGFVSEGIGSYWPFLTGKMVNQANILLKQIMDAPETHYILTPNQHVGAYATSFSPQWVAREYINANGFTFNKTTPSKLALLGWTPENIEVSGKTIPDYFFDVSLQKEVGVEGYAKGAEIIKQFFEKELKNYNCDKLDPLGRKIIEIFHDNGSIDDYDSVL